MHRLRCCDSDNISPSRATGGEKLTLVTGMKRIRRPGQIMSNALKPIIRVLGKGGAPGRLSCTPPAPPTHRQDEATRNRAGAVYGASVRADMRRKRSEAGTDYGSRGGPNDAPRGTLTSGATARDATKRYTKEGKLWTVDSEEPVDRSLSPAARVRIKRSSRNFLGITTAALMIAHVIPNFASVGETTPLGESLAHIEVVAERPDAPDYARDLFGGWQPRPVDGHPCNTQQFMIATQLSEVEINYPCAIITASGQDPYSGDWLEYGSADAPIEVDHIFPLAAAWDLGAWQWDMETRMAFANDPLNLAAVSKEQNQAKKDLLPGQWMPRRKASHCWYARRLTQVAVAYQLPLPASDVTTMKRSCAIRERHVMWLL